MLVGLQPISVISKQLRLFGTQSRYAVDRGNMSDTIVSAVFTQAAAVAS